MTVATLSPDTPTFTPARVDTFALSLDRRQLIYTRLRQSAAMASGLEAIAHRAIDNGECTPEQLDHIAELAGHMTEQLATLSALFIEMSGGHQ